MSSYPVPKEIDNLLAEWVALEKLRDTYAKLPFCYRRAVKAAKEAEIKKRSFWQKLYELYPEMRDGTWTYRPYEMTVESKE
ncbi:MAG: hypothetical protein ABIE47_16835 [Pseudomonadota bacterium]